MELPVSTNDIINGFLLKFYFNQNKHSQWVYIYYPMNVRRNFDIPFNFIGNCYGYVSGKLSSEKFGKCTIQELAVENKRILDEYTERDTIKEHEWAEYWYKNRKIPPWFVFHNWLFGKTKVYTTNLYNKEIMTMHFGDAKVIHVIRRYMRGSSICPSFDSAILPSSNGIVTITISLTKRQLEKLNSLAEKSTLVDRIGELKY
uniref:Uncharacterized protein n=1 Tax=Candidatus Kentrum sp. LPFa TaxID=2126335 RepID=A0A450XHF3_9GAMM|nr:MAG: hypothetical protein BECKLPF1236A_GA0070988_1007210 [Candidatus Kentron sp. LPFa]VFK28732.1 MAG: hypothetical protein BECKLPF1236C_GA0070990_100739 [Candidatus Kentron sp. LPFa]